MNSASWHDLRSLVDDGDISEEELDEDESYAMSFDSFDEYQEGMSDSLASAAFEDAAYGRPDDPYYGPEYPIFRERDD